MSSSEKDILGKVLLEKAARALEKNFFETTFCDTKEEAVKMLEMLIGSEKSIGYGGSRTLEEIGFFDYFTTERYPGLLDRNRPGLSPEEKKSLQLKALGADFFISSANAVSITGELVFIDKWGNRCGGVTYGPAKRIIIAGRNKVTNSLTEAIGRASHKAAVLNNIRFDTGNPCTKTGECMNCETDNRICGVTTILQRSFPEKSILVILINEDLGF